MEGGIGREGGREEGKGGGRERERENFWPLVDFIIKSNVP